METNLFRNFSFLDCRFLCVISFKALKNIFRIVDENTEETNVEHVGRL